MRQVVFKKGKVVLEEVPAPKLNNNSVLVKNLFSLISSGTELASLTFSQKPLPAKVLRYPTKLAKGLRLVKEHGLWDSYKIVTGMLNAGITPGYSSAGEVIRVGKNIKDIKKGDLVACAGANLASHAEFVVVPRNLVVRVPEGVSGEEAASTTLGAIALQGVRQADLRVGESAVVIGLGLVGQLVVQILLASGVKVIGIEPSISRIKKAQENGLVNAFRPQKNLRHKIYALTSFQGADATIITAANPNDNTIINQALEFTRKRGKVVVLGDVGLQINRLAWYEKEIDLRISTSYGPGRGDPEYEKKGIDYPYAYVRWTENRNMQAYLEMVKNKKINFLSLVGGKYSFEDAALAYRLLNSPKKPLAVLLSYSEDKEEKTPETLVVLNKEPSSLSGKIEVGIIGVGAFAQTIHLPNLARLKKNFHLRGVCTHQQVKAKYFARRYGASLATTDYHDLLADPKINLIFITTRHSSHAQIVKEALQAGKNVFVEKPLCMTEQELQEIEEIIRHPTTSVSPILTVGFNRRFSPFIERIQEIIKARRNPLLISYRVNDNYLLPSHWVNTSEGGGRVIGNACHMFDLFCYLTQSTPQEVSAFSITPKDNFYLSTDNFIASIKFKDSSLANLIYTTQGYEKFPKEYMELYSEGVTFVLDDYRRLRSYGVKASLTLPRQDKGHLQELKKLATCLYQKRWPIPWEEIYAATKLTLEVDKLIKKVP